ncbi:MAG TPA: LLM class flavin-dependent oxidoreductase [Chloroflexi bacterium]|nr:LLM class flavin-dependent oxidoreductase [Chloroflexota bacterium]
MADYRHDLIFGAFITPTAEPIMHAVDLAIVADRAELDFVTFQDHPYQPSFHDTWTLLSYVAARTEHVRLSGNVLNLPLRQPAVLARSVASLDRLSGGRVELGIGAGSFWDAIQAMGGRRLSPGQSVDALEESIDIMRQIWDTSTRGGARVDGMHYQVRGARRGPAPAHDINIWVGAYKPRMLRLVGRKADGVLPSLSYLPGGLTDLDGINAIIDDSAAAAGRDPSAIRRLLNIAGQFSSTSRGLFNGTPRDWAEQIAAVAVQYGVSGFFVAADDAQTIEVFAREVAPAARELVAASRGAGV